jgi:hypothetical protein
MTERAAAGADAGGHGARARRSRRDAAPAPCPTLVKDAIGMAKRSSPAPAGNVIEFAAARQRRAAAAAAQAAAQAAGDPDDGTVMMLTDALLLLFHLRSGRHSPAACRELEQSVRIAVAQRPMAEIVDVSDETWSVIAAVDLRDAIASSSERFDADWAAD